MIISDDDMLLLIFGRVIASDGSMRRTFRARGYGPTYINLGKWLSSIKLVNEWHNMPWYGWEFTDPSDEEVLRRIWSDHFIGDDEDHYEDIEAPLIRTKVSPEQFTNK